MHFAYEIIFQILIRLPVESLLRFKLVCKLWRLMISDRVFIKAHLERSKTMTIRDLSFHHGRSNQMVSVGYKQLNLKLVPTYYFPFQYSIDDQDDDRYFHRKAKLLASCNGLILLSEGERCYYLWNPSTRLYKQLSSRGPSFFKSCCSAFALGYDEACDAYKVVRILRVASYMDKKFFRHPSKNIHEYDATSVKVYNCKSESWKKLEGIFPYNIFQSGQGVTVNGAPHWRVFRKEENSHRGIMNFVIIYFDFVDENFKEVEAPTWFVRESDAALCAFDEQLCLVRCVNTISSARPSFSNAEIWVMKEYGVSESWTHLFTINKADESVVPLSFRTDRKLLIDKNNGLVLYDLDKPNFEVDIMPFAYYRVFERTTYVESLVSPHGGNETVG